MIRYKFFPFSSLQHFTLFPNHQLYPHLMSNTTTFRISTNIQYQAKIQARYSTHRTTRNTQQKAKLLSSDFSGLILDPILQRLEDPSIEPGFQDPRNCLVFWARPPAHIRSLVDGIQQQLLALAPRTFSSIPLPYPSLKNINSKTKW